MCTDTQTAVCPCWHTCMQTHCSLLGFYCPHHYQSCALQKLVVCLHTCLFAAQRQGFKRNVCQNLFMALEAVWTTHICYLFTNSSCHHALIRHWQQNKTQEFSYKDCHRLIQRQFQIRQANPCPNFPSNIMNCWFSSGIHIFSSKWQRIPPLPPLPLQI